MTGSVVAVSADADTLARDVAVLLCQRLAAIQAGRPSASLVLTGGTIAGKIYARVADHPGGAGPDWGQVDLWWGDERFVPEGSPDRNDLVVRQTLLAALPFDPARVHPMPAAGGVYGDDTALAAAVYAAELARAAHGTGSDVPAFDICLLGVGPDGHCASLFPGRPELDVQGPSVIAVHDSPKPPPTRLSLTFRALDRAAEIWFVASGAEKAEAVARAMAGAPVEQVPSARPRGRELTRWLLDRTAAQLLP